MRIYLDNNATTPLLPEVAAALGDSIESTWGNPSNTYESAQVSREAIEEAREAVARLVGADQSSLVFVSGGTEANNMVVRSAFTEPVAKRKWITSTVEHSSILRTCEALESHGVTVTYVPVDGLGQVDLDQLEREITDDTALVSVQWVNSETGVIQPVETIGTLCRERGVLFHTDAAQAVGKIEINVSTLPVDFLSLTAHKIHGPQGVGAVYAAQSKWLHPFLFGGPQESGLRAGTENLPGIVGMGAAARLRSERFSSVEHLLRSLRDTFERKVSQAVGEVSVNGRSERVSNTANLRFDGVDGQALVALR